MQPGTAQGRREKGLFNQLVSHSQGNKYDQGDRVDASFYFRWIGDDNANLFSSYTGFLKRRHYKPFGSQTQIPRLRPTLLKC